MTDGSDDSAWSDSSAYVDNAYRTTRNRKRRKLEQTRSQKKDVGPSLSFSPLLDVIHQDGAPEVDSSFDSFMETLLPDYLQDRARIQAEEGETDEMGQRLRSLTRYEVSNLIDEIDSGKLVAPSPALEAVVLRKLKLQRERRRVGLPEDSLKRSYEGHVTILSPTRMSPASSPQVIDALYLIKTTLYEHSFLSRLAKIPERTIGVVAVDWDTVSPWMNLMCDIRDHYSIAHPEREQAYDVGAPIIYAPLRSCHLDQVHDLLHRVFWNGIDVSDSLQYKPEQSTVVTTYKNLVVGAAFLSSPEETYITYLVVRAGWENSGIATTMLHQLIAMNPHKDITLHVSANNSAMLLYNRFGFKAEEFVAGFYEDYVDPDSRTSKNAFRLRLRR